MKLFYNKNWLFLLTLYLFIFTTINREFLLFGQDLRVIIIMFSLLLIFLKIKSWGCLLKGIRMIELSFFLLYIFMAISNIGYFYIDFAIDVEVFKNLVILHLNNLLIIILCFLYKGSLERKKVYLYIKCSVFILLISMLILYFGGNLSVFIGENIKVMSVGVFHYNLFGENFRVAGFAQDPNYATIFLVIGLFCCFADKIKFNFINIIYILLCLFGIAISWSKTTILAVVITSIITGIIYLLKSKYDFKKINFKIFWWLIPSGIFFLFLIFPIENLNINSQTLSTRFYMWGYARKLFEQSMLFGSGIGSFRVFFNHTGNWLVQAHNTYWQVLSEIGIFGMISCILIFFNNLNLGNNKHKILILIMLIWAMLFEMLYLQVFVLVFYILLLVNVGEEYEK